MSELNNDIMRDSNLDLVAALRTTTPPPKKEPEKPQAMSAIDQAIAEKRSTTAGFVDDVEASKAEQAPIRPSYDSDEAREEFSSKMDEMEHDVDKAKKVVVIRQPTNPAEYAQMITEVDAVVIGDDGGAIVPEDAIYIIPKTPEVIARMEELKKQQESGEDVAEQTSDIQEVEDAQQKYKDTVVRILIDKTGMGANIHFDNEESKAIEVADVIQLCEVEDQDLRIIDVERPEDDGTPFMQAVESHQLSVSKVPMTFPGSGFKAQMCGLSWGEYADITLDTDTETADDYLNFDKLYKRYSTIYNNMKNVSVGPFESFEDFLRNFAHDDSPLALYGLLLATQPEVDSLYMNCQKSGCKKRFLYKYSPRGVIDLETASNEMLSALESITESTPDNRMTLFKNSRVNKRKRIKLGVSEYLVDIGLASAYDYLYQILPIVQEYSAIEDTMSDTDPRKSIPAMLLGVRAVYIPSKNGSYIATRNAHDIADAILSLPTQDAVVLEAAVQAYRGQFQVGFSLKNIECPYCHNKTKRVPIDVDTLVFQIRLRQINTHVTVKNFPTF